MRRVSIRLTAPLVLSVLVVSTCAKGDTGDRRPDILAAAIEWAVDDFRESRGLPSFDETVYVQELSERGLSATTEAAVIDRVGDRIEVRFIDNASEAIDTTKPEDPVRGRGLLIRVGSVPERPSSKATLYLDTYVRGDDAEAFNVSVSLAEGRWHVVDQPTRTLRRT